MDNQKWYQITAWRKDNGNQIDHDIIGWDKALNTWNKIVDTGIWCNVEVEGVSIFYNGKPIPAEEVA